MKPSRAACALALAAPGCVSVSGPCTVTTSRSSEGAGLASVVCEQGGSAAMLAPAGAIRALEGSHAASAASGAAP